MKNPSLFFLMIMISVGLLLSNSRQVSAQPPRSPLFGTDIVMHNMPDRDQRNVAVCSAFNGWLFAVYTYQIDISPYIEILRSKDHGVTWEVLLDGGFGFINEITTGIDIIACGNSLSTLQIFLASTCMDSTSYPTHMGRIFVARYKGEPFAPEQLLTTYGIGWYKDVALVSDQSCPADPSDPFNMAVVFSSAGPRDTVVMYSSSNGGLSFDSRRVVTTSSRKIEKVTATYGRSASHPEGGYYVAWEEKDELNDLTGHIFTAHTTNGINSPFSPKVCIDSLYPGFIHRVRNPVIAAQAGLFDNDSSDLTSVLLFEKYSEATDSWNIRGLYNKRSALSNDFRELFITDTTGVTTMPDICFNPFDSTFMFTCFDPANKKLPFLLNSVNLEEPDSWEVVSAGYNDSDSIDAPFPRTGLDYDKKAGFTYWVRSQAPGNGVVMFDADYNYYTGDQDPDELPDATGSQCHPNPCNTYTFIPFILPEPARVTIVMYSSDGHFCSTLTDQFYPEGKHVVRADVSGLASGSYFYRISSGSSLYSGKIIVIH